MSKFNGALNVYSIILAKNIEETTNRKNGPSINIHLNLH